MFGVNLAPVNRREHAEAIVRKAGFRGATTVDPGNAVPSEPFTLKRIRVNGDESVSQVLESVRSPASIGAQAGAGTG